MAISPLRPSQAMEEKTSAVGSSSSSSVQPFPSHLIPNLADDVAVQCLARIPCSYDLNLSLVSRSWRAAFKSPLLFDNRLLLNCTQNFLYLNIRINSSFTWYVLHLNDHTNPRSLIPLPSLPSQPIGAAFVILGTKIYLLGGTINDIPSNTVWVFDARFCRWEMGPKMRVGREFAAAGVVNGKIYVIGGCVVDSWSRSMNWSEVFDPATQSWSSVPSPIEIRDKWMHGNAVIDDKIYAMADRGGVVYDAVAGEWSNEVPKKLDLGWRGRAAVVGGVLYCYDYLGKIRGYDVVEDKWEELKGIEKGLPKFLCGATMVNVGDRLCVVWEGKNHGKKMEVFCAEIDVCRDANGGLIGSIIWRDVILSVPNRSAIVHCMAVTL